MGGRESYSTFPPTRLTFVLFILSIIFIGGNHDKEANIDEVEVITIEEFPKIINEEVPEPEPLTWDDLVIPHMLNGWSAQVVNWVSDKDYAYDSIPIVIK